MLIKRVTKGGSLELDLEGNKRRTKTGTKFTKKMSKKVVYRYSSKLTKFFRKIRNADVLRGTRVTVLTSQPCTRHCTQ